MKRVPISQVNKTIAAWRERERELIAIIKRLRRQCGVKALRKKGHRVMKITAEWAGMKFALIEETHEHPPAHQIVTPCESYKDLQNKVCIAVFGKNLIDLPAQFRPEFDGIMQELADDGRVNFEGDPSLSVALYSPPIRKRRGTT